MESTEATKKEEQEEESLNQEFFDQTENMEDYICIICQRIPFPSKAVEVSCCHHIFCYNCISTWIKIKNTCPLCKNSFSNGINDEKINLIKDKNKILFRMLSNQKLNCPLKCGWKGNFSEYEGHFASCPNKPSECKYSKYGCTFKDTKEKIKEHEEGKNKKHLKIVIEYLEANKNKIFVDCHEHPLTLSVVEGRTWACNLGYYGDRNCPSGRMFFPHPSFKCAECDYDLCLQCLYNHMKK